VWDGVSDARISFSASSLASSRPSHALEQMARLTENLNLQRGLLRHLDSISSINLHDNVKVTSISREEKDGGWPLVHLSDGRILRARLLVDYLRRLFNRLLTRVLSGWCRWIQFSRPLICRDKLVRLVLQCTSHRSHTLSSSPRRIRAGQYHCIPAFLTHRSHCLPAPFSDSLVIGLVDQATTGSRSDRC
jgi:hypothetical protein